MGQTCTNICHKKEKCQQNKEPLIKTMIKLVDDVTDSLIAEKPNLKDILLEVSRTLKNILTVKIKNSNLVKKRKNTKSNLEVEPDIIYDLNFNLHGEIKLMYPITFNSILRRHFRKQLEDTFEEVKAQENDKERSNFLDHTKQGQSTHLLSCDF